MAFHNSIKVTIDYPSNHKSGRMPVLDLEQWIGQAEIALHVNKFSILIT